jgi:hypothetical protein
MKKFFSVINHFIDRFLFSAMVCISINLVIICIAVLIGSGPALFNSVMRGWDAGDFLVVMLGMPALWAVVLMLGDTALKIVDKKS